MSREHLISTTSNQRPGPLAFQSAGVLADAFMQTNKIPWLIAIFLLLVVLGGQDTGAWSLILIGVLLWGVWAPRLLDLHRCADRLHVPGNTQIFAGAFAAMVLLSAFIVGSGAWLLDRNPVASVMTMLASVAILGFMWTTTPKIAGMGLYIDWVVGIAALITISEWTDNMLARPFIGANAMYYLFMAGCVLIFGSVFAWRWRAIVRMPSIPESFDRTPLAMGRWNKSIHSNLDADNSPPAANRWSIENADVSLRDLYGPTFGKRWWARVAYLFIVSLFIVYVLAALMLDDEDMPSGLLFTWIFLTMLANTLLACLWVREAPYLARRGLSELALLPASRARWLWFTAIFASTNKISIHVAGVLFLVFVVFPWVSH